MLANFIVRLTSALAYCSVVSFVPVVRQSCLRVQWLCTDSHQAGTIYHGDYVSHGMCKMKLNEDLIESVAIALVSTSVAAC